MVLLKMDLSISPNSLNLYRGKKVSIGVHDAISIVTRGIDPAGNCYMCTMDALVKRITSTDVQVYEPATQGRFSIKLNEFLDVRFSDYNYDKPTLHPVRAIHIAKRSRITKAMYMDTKAADKFSTENLRASYSETFDLIGHRFLDHVTYNCETIAQLVDMDDRFAYLSNNDTCNIKLKEFKNPILFFTKNLEPQLIDSDAEILL